MAYTVGTFVATDEMRALVNQVLDSGRLSYGPLSRRFEKEFAHMHGCDYGVLSNSGTSSLHVALQAMKELYGWDDGDEVIVPALTFVATVNVVYHCRLKPVLVDIEPNYYAINPDLIGDAISSRTRAIIPVHPFGQPADMTRIMQVARDSELLVIEDSCESMFVDHNGKPVGSWGDVGCFSTYVAHIITGGVGGIATTNNLDLAHRMRSLVNHGIDLTELPIGREYEPSFLSRNFRFTSVGHSFRVTELEAAVLLPQLKTADRNTIHRALNAAKIVKIFSPYEEVVQLPRWRKNTEDAHMVFPLAMLYSTKTSIVEHLRKNDIEVRDALPLTNQPCYDFNEADYPVARWMNESGFYIGCHTGLADEDFAHLQTVIDQWFGGKRG